METPPIFPPEQQGLYDPATEHDACGVGFVANIKGRKSHGLVRDALQILLNLDHRGAVGADPLVGDGAGCLIQIPDALLRDWAEKNKVNLPPPGHYAVAMCFLPQDAKARDFAVKQFQHFIKVEGQVLLGWRDVPVYDGADLTVGCTLDGPLLIEERTTTAFVGPKDRLEVDASTQPLPDEEALTWIEGWKVLV